MDQNIRNAILEARKIRRVMYLRQSWLPTFITKYKGQYNKENNVKIVLRSFIKKYFLTNVINISKNEIVYIPGLFRKRILILDENEREPAISKIVPNKKIKKIKTIKLVKSDTSSVNTTDDIIANRLNYNDDDCDISDIVKQSLVEYEKTEREILNKIMMETKNQTKKSDLLYDEYSSEEDPELLDAIMLSLEQDANKILGYVCIDIRVYGLDPTQPIYINGKKYFLNEKQIDYIVSLWNKINLDSNAGVKFHQMIEYQKAMSVDMKTLGC